MVEEQHKSLLPYNSFHIDAQADRFVSITDVDALMEIRHLEPGNPVLVLGGGSNILFTKDVKGLVLKMDIRGINLIKEDESHVYVRAGAGENWHSFVLKPGVLLKHPHLYRETDYNPKAGVRKCYNNYLLLKMGRV